jgi:hypothetical protein
LARLRCRGLTSPPPSHLPSRCVAPSPRVVALTISHCDSLRGGAAARGLLELPRRHSCDVLVQWRAHGATQA